MKKLMTAMIVGIAVLAAAGTATAYPISQSETVSNDYFFLGDFHTYDYASCIDFYTNQPNGIVGGAWIGTAAGLDRTLSWAHTLPGDLQVPPDVINRAKLWIDGAYIDNSGNTVKVGSLWDWNGLDSWGLDNTTYNLTGVNVPGFWNNGSLGVTVWGNERSFRIDKAILMIDYTNGGDDRPNDAIPEPTTIALLGLGLAGLGLVKRRTNG